MKINLLISAIIGGLLSTFSNVALADFDPSFMQKHSVRVFVKKAGEQKGLVSSGFFWKTADQIVTSLHAVPHKDGITVECDGEKKKAKVVKTLARADLVLLRLEKPGWIYPHKCLPISSFDRAKPAAGTDLWTWGYYSGATSGTSRTLLKQGASNETLKGLLHSAIAAQLEALGVPSIDLKVYYVQGGSAPGYSGAPVVDESKSLIGIVDGGLDKGASDYNWLIPAKHLDELLASTTDEIPSTLADGAGHLFSTGIAEPVADPIIAYESDGQYYEWVLTKEARSLSNIASTAIEAEHVEKLLNLFSPSEGMLAADDIEFDIYKEMNSGLVIAAPAGQEIYSQAGDLHSLLSDSSGTPNGIKYMVFDEQVRNSQNEVVEPGHPSFFQNYISETFSGGVGCNIFGSFVCTIDMPTMSVVDFGQGSKVLRFGALFAFDGDPEYSYVSIAVRNNKAFIAWASLESRTEPEFFKCLSVIELPSDEADSCQYSVAMQKQLSQLIAAHLTTFSGVVANNGEQIVVSKFVYDSEMDDTAPTYVSYSNGGGQRRLNFIDLGNKKWKFYSRSGAEIAEELRREDGLRGRQAVIKHKNTQYLIPVNGGAYYKSIDGSAWVAEGIVAAEIKYAHVPYLEGGELRFLYSGENRWRVYVDDKIEPFTELRRFSAEDGSTEVAELNSGETTYLVPLSGGKVHRINSDNQKVPAGMIEVGEIIKGPIP